MPVYKDDNPTKDGRKYYYVISLTKGGKRKQIKSHKYKTLKEAKQAEAQTLLDIGKMPSNDITFNQASKVFLAEKKPRLKTQSYDRLEVMLGHFLRTLGDISISKLTLTDYQMALQDIDNYERNGKRLKNTYKNKLIRTFKQLLAFTDKRYDVTSNIPLKVDNYRNEDKEEMKFITYDEFKQFITVVDNPIYNALFITLYFMGLRCGEANALTWDDIDFEKGTLSVRHTVNTKKTINGNYEITSPKTKASIRTLPMPQIVSNALFGLHEHQDVFSENVSPAFVFGGQTSIPESSITKNKNKYFKLAGMSPIRIHDFRHSCASYLINNGASALLVSKWLGHANVSMTLNTYSHLWKNELTDIVSLIDKNTKIVT